MKATTKQNEAKNANAKPAAKPGTLYGKPTFKSRRRPNPYLPGTENWNRWNGGLEVIA